MARKTKENIYLPQEKAAIASEFSPALAEVLETVAPAWGNKVIVEPTPEQEAEAAPSILFRLRQMGDQGLRAVMQKQENK